MIAFAFYDLFNNRNYGTDGSAGSAGAGVVSAGIAAPFFFFFSLAGAAGSSTREKPFGWLLIPPLFISNTNEKRKVLSNGLRCAEVGNR
jgi:hypothetical protein